MSALFPLSVTGAHVRRKGKTLVGPVDLSLDDPRGITVVIGPNGSGKTSLLRLLHGILRLNDGQVRWACDDGEAHHQQAFVFQSPILLRRTVLDNIAYPLRLQGSSKSDARTAAQTAGAAVGLAEALLRPAASLSGGERQKMALARALIANPSLLFLDEPCSALDGRATRDIEEILRRASETGTRLIMSTHDMGQARRLADDVVFLLNGLVCEHSPADTFFEAPATLQAAAFLRGDIVE